VLDHQEFPTSLAQAFDLNNPDIQDWEVALIREAAKMGKYTISNHGFERMKERSISSKDVQNVLINGKAVSKDLPGNSLGRKPGINFKGNAMDGRCVNVKVSWVKGYIVVTVHEVGK
jgi:hypothetical protein